jgi:hypothetical protein
MLQDLVAQNGMEGFISNRQRHTVPIEIRPAVGWQIHSKVSFNLGKEVTVRLIATAKIKEPSPGIMGLLLNRFLQQSPGKV